MLFGILTVCALAPSARALAPDGGAQPQSRDATRRLAARGFERASPSSSGAPGGPPRDLVVLCHRTPDRVARGRFKLDNLPDGRVDLLARCASAAVGSLW